MTATILDQFDLSPEQRRAALARGCDVVVTAGAGTGKTRTLVARYVSLLDDMAGEDGDGAPGLRRVVAVTFTRKAAREMRSRVRREIGDYLARPDLDERAAARWRAAYNGLDAARIDTIHTLCAELLRSHPAEAGVDPRFDVLDETAAALLLQEAVEDALAWAAADPGFDPLFHLLGERDLHELIGLLLRGRLQMSEIRAARDAGGILDHWAARLEAEQADAIRRFLDSETVTAARDFLRQNEASLPDDRLEQQRRLALAALDAPGGSPAEQRRNLGILNEINTNVGSQKAWPSGKEQLDEVKERLRALRDGWRALAVVGLTLNHLDAAAAAAMPALYAVYDRALETYVARKTERGGLDFDDLERGALELLARDDIAAVWQEEIAALLVDEFQDTNERQRRLIRLLCPRPGRLFIVGDAKQSIYRFRGADVTVFEGEKARIEAGGGQAVDLDTSYRAHGPLLAGMNSLLRPILGDPSAGRRAWETPFAPLRHAPDRLPRLGSPYVEFHLTLGNKAAALPQAAAALAARLGELAAADQVRFGDVAILCRASSAFRYYEDAFDAAGIPYVTVAGKGFYDRPEIRDLLNALRAVDDPHDDLALAGLLRSPVIGLSDESLYRLVRARPRGHSLWSALGGAALPDDEQQARLDWARALVDDLHAQAGRAPVAVLLKAYLDRTHYRAVARLAGKPRALRNISKLLADVHRSELVSISRFLDTVQEMRAAGSQEGEARAEAGNAVQIMSIHAAKGLEFPVVVLGDAGGSPPRQSRTLLDDDLGVLLALGEEDPDHPRKSGKTVRAAAYELGRLVANAQEDAERKRLLYVALTRARELLIISGTGAKNVSGSTSWNGWLKELVAHTGLDDSDLAGQLEGDACIALERTLGETAVRATFYGKHYRPAMTPVIPVAAADPPPPDEAMLAPIAAAPADEQDRPDGDLPGQRRVWRVVPAEPDREAPAWVIGQIVHQALAAWRLPDDGFDAWAAGRARDLGLAGKPRVDGAVARSRHLLDRFLLTDLYRRMAAAERRLHEVPYFRQVAGETQRGTIDALFLSGGSWTVVDFKTDRIDDPTSIRRLLDETDYVDQVRRYGAAVEALLGARPRLLLCFLGVAGPDGAAVVHPVDG
jgi:ATP-dependent helicase/nuclease subunit A